MSEYISETSSALLEVLTRKTKTMSDKQKTPTQYLTERAPELRSNDSIAELCKSYCKKHNIPQSEVFSKMGDYWDNQPSVDGSITDMVRIWYLATMQLLDDEELDNLFEWFYK